MTWKEGALPALRELESTVLEIWTQHPEMNDYHAGRAYEAAYQHFRAQQCGQREPKPPALTGPDLDMFKAVQKIGEKLLTKGATPVKGMPNGDTNPINLDKLLEYLRELTRSVERHTKLGGRFGYLEFMRSFIP